MRVKEKNIWLPLPFLQSSKSSDNVFEADPEAVKIKDADRYLAISKVLHNDASLDVLVTILQHTLRLLM
jgi:hypothetical protein